MPKTGEGMLTMFNLTSYYRVLSKLSPKFCSVIKKVDFSIFVLEDFAWVFIILVFLLAPA